MVIVMLFARLNQDETNGMTQQLSELDEMTYRRREPPTSHTRQVARALSLGVLGRSTYRVTSKTAPQQFAKTELPHLRHRDKSSPNLPHLSTPQRTSHHNARKERSMSCEGFREPPPARHHRSPLHRDSFVLHMHAYHQSPTIAALPPHISAHLP